MATVVAAKSSTIAEARDRSPSYRILRARGSPPDCRGGQQPGAVDGRVAAAAGIDLDGHAAGVGVGASAADLDAHVLHLVGEPEPQMGLGEHLAVHRHAAVAIDNVGRHGRDGAAQEQKDVQPEPRYQPA